MGPTWVLSAPDGPHAGPKNLALKEAMEKESLMGFEFKTNFER